MAFLVFCFISIQRFPFTDRFGRCAKQSLRVFAPGDGIENELDKKSWRMFGYGKRNSVVRSLAFLILDRITLFAGLLILMTTGASAQGPPNSPPPTNSAPVNATR